MSAVLNADQVLAELDALWARLGKDAAEGEGVLRASAMTLVVFTDGAEEAASVTGTLAELIREHPSRAIVVRASAETPSLLVHRVVAQCWKPLDRPEQICCEHVEIDAGEALLGDIAPVLLALAAPDLPLVLWCRSARLLERRGCPAATLRPDKIIVDSEAFGNPRPALDWLAAEVAAGGAVYGDLAWTRLTRWREAIALLFDDSKCCLAAPQISEVGIFFGGGQAPAAAYYLAAWVLTAADVAAKVRFAPLAEAVPGIAEVRLVSPGLTIQARRVGDAAIEIRAGELRNRVALPRPGEAALLGEELSIVGHDPVFERALAAAAPLARE